MLGFPVVKPPGRFVDAVSGYKKRHFLSKRHANA